MDIIWQSAVAEGFVLSVQSAMNLVTRVAFLTLSHKLIWAFLTAIYRESPTVCGFLKISKTKPRRSDWGYKTIITSLKNHLYAPLNLQLFGVITSTLSSLITRNCTHACWSFAERCVSLAVCAVWLLLHTFRWCHYPPKWSGSVGCWVP